MSQGNVSNSSSHVEVLKREASQGDSHAIFELAKHYRWGWLVDSNPTLSLEYFMQAAKMGHIDANIELGKMYLQGDRELKIGIDIEKAKTYFTKAKNSIFNKHDPFNYNPEEARKKAELYLKAVNTIYGKPENAPSV
jgi:TPR repeat protein